MWDAVPDASALPPRMATALAASLTPLLDVMGARESGLPPLPRREGPLRAPGLGGGLQATPSAVDGIVQKEEQLARMSLWPLRSLPTETLAALLHAASFAARSANCGGEAAESLAPGCTFAV